MTRIAAILTVHNRISETISCLEALYNQTCWLDNRRLEVYLTDDASTDGTAPAIAKQFPQVNILMGTGNLYWCGGMRLAFGRALKEGFDYYLWLNNDTKIFPDALQVLLATSQQVGFDAVVVGSTCNPETGVHTYGGVRRASRWHKLKFTPTPPGNTPKQAETMNGNFVLIPGQIAGTMGNLDPIFTHGMGDFDYGLRLSKLGYKVMIAPGYVAHCKRNSLNNTWQDLTLPTKERWEKIQGPLGIPPREYAHFAKRHAGNLWFIYWALPYLRTLIPVHLFMKRYFQK